MAKKKEKKEMNEDEMKITSEQQRKWERAARRQVKIERGEHLNRYGAGAHKTSKRDIQDIESKTLTPEELQQIIKEETEGW